MLLFLLHNHSPSLPLTPRPPPDMLHALFGEVTQRVTILGQKLCLHVFRPFPILEQELKISQLGTLLPECSVSFFVFCTQIDVLSFCVSFVWRFGFFVFVFVLGGCLGDFFCFVLFYFMFLLCLRSKLTFREKLEN